MSGSGSSRGRSTCLNPSLSCFDRLAGRSADGSVSNAETDITWGMTKRTNWTRSRAGENFVESYTVLGGRGL